MPDDQMLAGLLGTLYASPMQPNLWEVFLAELSAMCGISRAALLVHDMANADHRIAALLGDSVKESVPAYEAHYCRFDEWTSRLARQKPPLRIFHGEELWPDSLMFKSVFYNEFLTKFDVCQIAGIVNISGPQTMEALSFYRGPREAPIDREKIAILGFVMPHLQTALATRRQLIWLEARVSDMENSLNQLQSGLVLLNRAGKVVFANNTARSIFAEGDGIFLSRSTLKATSIVETSKLRDTIAKAAETANSKALIGGGAMPICRSRKKPLHVLVSPFSLERELISGGATVAVFISDPERQPAPPEETLRTFFGLTSAEAKLALTMLEGNSLSEAAELKRVSRETVKSQINSIFRKTGTKRQGELIRLLSCLPGE
jgi:DNA-binding CsgD family transcriptional regulator